MGALFSSKNFFQKDRNRQRFSIARKNRKALGGGGHFRGPKNRCRSFTCVRKSQSQSQTSIATLGALRLLPLAHLQSCLRAQKIREGFQNLYENQRALLRHPCDLLQAPTTISFAAPRTCVASAAPSASWKRLLTPLPGSKMRAGPSCGQGMLHLWEMCVPIFGRRYTRTRKQGYCKSGCEGQREEESIRATFWHSKKLSISPTISELL